MTELNIMLPIYSIPYYNNQQLFQITRVDVILNKHYRMVLIKGGFFCLESHVPANYHNIIFIRFCSL